MGKTLDAHTENTVAYSPMNFRRCTSGRFCTTVKRPAPSHLGSDSNAFESVANVDNNFRHKQNNYTVKQKIIIFFDSLNLKKMLLEVPAC